MKKLIIAIIVLNCLGQNIFAQNDTLRMHNPNDVFSNFYNATIYPTQIARFDLPKPAIIKGFLIEFDGDAGSSVRLRFVGHEGGERLISLFSTHVPPIKITKPNSGREKVYVPLQKPYVKLDNVQFFCVFDSFQGMRLITDRTDHPYPCKSTDGGDYFYQYGIDASNQYRLFTAQNRAFAIDVILEYPQKESRNVFQDITEEAGFKLNHSNASIAAADINNDGFLDILVAGRLYLNQKDGKFIDVSDSLGIKNRFASVSGNAIIDINNDGQLDIVLFGHRDSSVVFVNDNGVFTEYVLPLHKYNALQSFSFADINFNGYPDLFVSQIWQTWPQGEPNYFYYNDQNLGFTDNTNVIYPEYDGTWNWPNRAWDPDRYIVERNRNSRGSQWVDFDNDGDLDLFVTNYFLQPDEFYRNNGDGTFADIILEKKIDQNKNGHNHGTGVDWYDYNNDGNIDLLLPQFAHPRFIGTYDHRGTTIYKNVGPPDYHFADMVGQINNYPGLKSPIGIELEETHAGGAWGDINNDGLVDFLMTVYYGCRYISLYEQQPDNTFQMKTFEYGLQNINTGNDLVWLDFDNDGFLDLACGVGNRFRLFKNVAYNDRNWVALDLRSTSANKFAIGARAYVHAGGKVFMQEVSAGRGQRMQKPYRLHFGFNYIQNIDSVVVLWPTKPQIREVFKGLQMKNIYSLTEGGGIAVSVKDDIHDTEFSATVYPNPATNYLEVFLNNNFSENSINISICNLLGEELLTRSFPHAQELCRLDLNNISKGVYLLRIDTGKEVLIKKFVKTGY